MNAPRMLMQTARRFGTSTARQGTKDVHPGYIKIRENYRKFQNPDDLPVHLKAGTRDKALFFVTCVLTIVGVLGSFEFYYRAAWPQTKKD